MDICTPFQVSILILLSFHNLEFFMSLISKTSQIYCSATKMLNMLSPLLDIALRLWVAKIFFQSGLTKIQSWETTMMLFQYEYNVPFISPEAAAYLGTSAELTLPVLLVFGLISRPTALALFIFNYVAMISYADISPAGINDHIMWGFMLAVTFFHGPGKLSLDHWLCHRCSNQDTH